MEQNKRVNEEELDWDGDVSTLDGAPYSGIAFLRYPDGSLEREVSFKDGFEQGICREWFPNGRMKREWCAKQGRAEGEIKEWHEAGAIKSVGTYEFGVELQFTKWDELGAVIILRKIDESGPIGDYLRQMREKNS